MLKRLVKSVLQVHDTGCLRHAVYGDIYPPNYNMGCDLNPEVPPIYNARGERMDAFFIRDRHFANDPYTASHAPTYWIWDRYNFGLKTHFYTHWEMLRTMGHPDRRYGLLVESEAIVPEDYRIFDTHPGLATDFDRVFTYSERLLNELPNARFFPACARPWYGEAWGGGALDDHAYERKTKNVSICSSAKTLCDLHRYRLEIARRCRREGLADAYGTFDGGVPIRIAETLTDYRYSFAIENSLSRYFFTERLTNCFLSMTVPIYCGTPAIGEFFNTDGMILLRPGEDVGPVLRTCSEKDYESRIPALQDNYRRALEYRNMWDWLYEKHLKK